AALSTAGKLEIDQSSIGEMGAPKTRRHAAMDRIKAMRIAEKVRRRLRRAADAGNLGDAMRLDRQLETGLNDGRRYGVVATAGAQGGDRAFIVAVGIAQCVLGKLRMVEFWVGEIRHGDR